jgi:nucleotide-binding universal stress UspA family protein
MRDILAYCESFKNWSTSVDYAARLAKAFDGQLTGVYVCPSSSSMVPSYEAPGLRAELYEATRQLEDEAYGAAPSFEAFVRERGVVNASWLVAEDEVPRALALAGNWHDLLVVGRTAHTPWGSLSAVGSIVLGSGMPCVAVPQGHAALVALDCMAIAWNGSCEAIRTVHAALPLLKRARHVVILHGAQHPPASMGAWKPRFELADYLSKHGIASESRMLPETEEVTGETLLQAAHEAKANMIVMGAYGHTRFSEWVLGGATRSILDQATIPLFMRH